MIEPPLLVTKRQPCSCTARMQAIKHHTHTYKHTQLARYITLDLEQAPCPLQ